MAQLAVDQGELVVGDALHQVAVVRDQKQRARPAVEQSLDRRQHVGVQIVARLVEDEHVGLVEQDEHQGKAALLTARKILDRLVEVVARELQPLQKLGGCHGLAVEHRTAPEAPDNLAHAVAAVFHQLVEMLRQDGEPHRFADLHRAGIGCLKPLDRAQQRGLAHAVAADDAVAVTWPDDPIEPVEHRPPVEANRHLLHLHDLLAQARHRHALELDGVAQLRHVGDERARRLHAELRLGRARLRPA